MFVALVWLTNNHMFGFGDFWENQPRNFRKFWNCPSKSRVIYALWQFIPNHPPKHVITSTYLSSKSKNNCLFKVYNRNTKKKCEICSKLTTKTAERSYWRYIFLWKSYMGASQIHYINAVNVFKELPRWRSIKWLFVNFGHFQYV